MAAVAARLATLAAVDAAIAVAVAAVMVVAAAEDVVAAAAVLTAIVDLVGHAAHRLERGIFALTTITCSTANGKTMTTVLVLRQATPARWPTTPT